MHADLPALVRLAEGGNADATRQLFAALYDELHQVARRQIAKTGGLGSLGTTTLLHDAYLSMAGRDAAQFVDRTHFMAYAARAMRGLIIDYGRREQAVKRGGEFHITGSLSSADIAAPRAGGDTDLEQLGDALEQLTAIDPSLAQLVDLHFFSGFALVEIAAMRGVSERTIQRDWRKARTLLRQFMRADIVDPMDD